MFGIADWDSRTEHLIGADGIERLRNARVLIAGVGGVGGYAVEMLARTGVGHLTLIDSDNVAPSNLNRQIIATIPGLGRPKVELFAERIREINPDIRVDARIGFITPDNVASLVGGNYDYIVDAIDTVAPKVALIMECLKTGTPIISSMGAGGRMDPSRVRYSDIWETREDGLAKAVRQRLKRNGIRKRLLTVSSTEAPRKSSVIECDMQNKRSSYGTTAIIPSIFGIFIAGHVISKLTGA
ncbi:MAG: tRNA threonylcarbamoyladenosine dehydratase [Candidatus Amulumruptor caecigallinarius]|nr:tRNA threonylcarbamoyladenosine dehydratase [Candidatus Amulumruptor caecigallinarius]